MTPNYVEKSSETIGGSDNSFSLIYKVNLYNSHHPSKGQETTSRPARMEVPHPGPHSPGR